MSLKFMLAVDRYIGAVLIILLNYLARLLGFALKRDHDLHPKGDILIIKMLGGGSLVIALPALLGIRRAYPNVKMKLFATAGVKPFAETLGVFDEIIILDDGSLFTAIMSGFRCIYDCFGCDTVIDLEIYSHFSTVLSLLTCARNRIGFFFGEMGFRENLHTHRIFFHPGSPLYLHYDRICEILGAKVVPPLECGKHVKSKIGISDTTPKVTRIVVGCGCSGLAPERKLAPEQWAKHVFAPANDKNREIIFLGTEGDKRDAEQVIDAVKKNNAWNGELKNLCGSMPLTASLRMLAESDEYWGIESSLLHYARLFGLKNKAFFGPTHPMRLRPVEGIQEDIRYRKTICSPCIHLVSKPPCHGDNLCMQWLFEPEGTGNRNANWIPVTSECQ
jgi:ADP-heptose:LPS heptosyltransferase